MAESNRQLQLEVSFFRMEKMKIVGNDYIVPITLDESQMDLYTYIANMNLIRSSPGLNRPLTPKKEIQHNSTTYKI